MRTVAATRTVVAVAMKTAGHAVPASGVSVAVVLTLLPALLSSARRHQLKPPTRA